MISDFVVNYKIMKSLIFAIIGDSHMFYIEARELA